MDVAGRSVVRPRRRGLARACPRIVIVASDGNETSEELAAAWRQLGVESAVAPAERLSARLRPGEALLGRLDVLPTLDGVEPGLLELLLLERRGVRVLNPAGALLSAHDKLRTAHQLARAGLPHPNTVRLTPRDVRPHLTPPLVVKPRFGSWGTDVFRCESALELERCLAEVHTRPWFRRHGALVQELVPSAGRDLRVLVAGGTAVGAIERTAAPGEWRTNISLGGSRRRRVPPHAAANLAVAAAEAIGADLVGVDLLPKDDGYLIVELNGAVEFNREYSLPGTNVYAEVARALGLLPERGRPGQTRPRVPLLAAQRER